MRKTTVARGLLFLGIAGLAGCANSDYAQSRKTREGVTINGSQFAPAEENDQNAFGRESDGLSSNPKTKPSKEDLGEAGKLCSNKSSLTGDPDKVEAFVNEVVDVKFVLKGVEKSVGCDTNEPEGLQGVRVVIVLERPEGADGVIDIVDSDLNPVDKKTPTKIIANTDKNGEVHVRLYTGSMYSNNPMYYINAWQADVEMAAIDVKIKKLPQKSDGDFFEGSKDTANDLTPPPGYSGITSGKAFVQIVNEDPLKQELFVDGKKRLRVKLLGSADATTEEFSEAPNEGVCWKFVSKRVKSSGSLDGKSARAIGVMDGEIKDQAGCSKTDATGAFWVEISTGDYYNERYFLNFFHPKATPLSYQIDTFVAPDTLGEQGNDAEITTTVSKDIDDPGGKFDSGKFDEKDTKTLIDQIFGTDACSEPVRSIYEQCYDPQCTFDCLDGQGTAECPENGFICTFEKNPDGTWSIIDKDGKPVKADLDGDCNCNDTQYTPDLKCSLPEKVTCSEGVCKGSGKACLDNINVVLDKGKDDKGNDTIVNKGVDTDGDGKVDVAPDECITDPTLPGCKSGYRFVWSDDIQQHFYNQKLSTPIGEEFPVYVKARDKITSEPNKSNVTGVTATLIRGSYPSNDAMLRLGSKDVENMAFSIDAGKEATLNFWSGKAFGALYYIQLRHNDVLPANIPIATSNVINMPSGEGDSPDDSVLKEGGEAVTPPSDMGKPDPNLGHCTLFVDPDEVEKVKNANGDALLTMTGEALKNNQSLATSSIETPIARTLVLNAALVCDRGSDRPSVVKNVKTYWKLTRGKSTYNNGTLLSTVKATDYTGVASSQFYAGTGYGATYYVSVFHPNATQDASCKKDCKARPAVFEIKVNDSKGSIPGPSEKDDPILPGDTTGTDKDGNKGICCNTANAESLGVCNPNPCTEEAVNCNDALKRTYIYCDKDKGTETHGEKPDVNKTLPTVACNVADFPACLEDTGECRDFAGNVVGEDDGDPTKKFVGGCMLLSFEGDDPLRSYIGTLQSVKVKLQQRTLNGIENVADTVYVTVNKAPDADGAFTSDKQRTSSKHGTTVFFFKTGSVITSYKLSVSHPNYVDDTGLMIPVSKMLHIVDKSLLETKKSQINSINLSTDSKKKNTYYYVMSSDYNKCDSKFAIVTKADAAKGCEAAQVPSTWKGIKLGGKDPKKEMCAKVGTTDSTSVKVPDNKSRYLAYAIQYEGERPISYGCIDNQYLPPPNCKEVPKFEEDNETPVMKDGEQVMDEVCETSLNLEIPMKEVPLALGSRYNTKSLIDLGPLVAIPDAKSCPETNRSVPCLIYRITELYKKFIGANPADTIVDNLEAYFLTPKTCMSDSGAGKKDKDCRGDGNSVCSTIESVSIIEKCTTDFKDCIKCDLSGVPSDKKPQNACATNSASKESSLCKDLDAKYSNSREVFKGSSCICAKMYYYTGGCENNQCYKWGGKIKPLFLKLAKSLLKKAFDKANIEDNLCKLVDALQYVEFTGNISFDTSNGNAGIGTVLNFTGATVPYINKSFELGRVLSGKVASASLPVDSSTVMIPDMGLNLSYGLLVVDVLKKVLPEAAFGEDKDGNAMLDFQNFIKCSSLIKGGIKIPVVGFTVSEAVIDGLCGIALRKVTEETYNLADQQYINLNMKLSGSGEIGSTNNTCKSKDGACEADVITGGLWSGTGTMRGVQESISGLWVASTAPLNSGNFPQLSYGDKSVEEFMAEHSVCRKMLRETANELEVSSNQACLGGSFDNPKARVSNHKCSDKKCSGAGIVVCDGGNFNALYANSTAAEIIRAANNACINISDDESCTGNPEIINGGKGINNSQCRDNYEPACEENPSIIVIKKDAGGAEYDVESIECEIVGECNEKDDSILCVKSGDDTYKCLKSKISESIHKACAGQCNEPGCIMNSEVTNCKDVDENGNETPAPKPAEIVAVWDFSNITKTSELKNMKYPKDTEGNEVTSLNLAFVNTGCDNLKEKVATPKLVQGKDGTLGAVGTDATFSHCDSAMKEDYRAGTFVITGSIDSKKITKVTFNVMGAGREISYGKGSAPSESSTKFISSDTLWENKEVVFEEPQSTLNMHIAPIGNGDVGMKAMRLDDIIVYAQ